MTEQKIAREKKAPTEGGLADQLRKQANAASVEVPAQDPAAGAARTRSLLAVLVVLLGAFAVEQLVFARQNQVEAWDAAPFNDTIEVAAITFSPSTKVANITVDSAAWQNVPAADRPALAKRWADDAAAKGATTIQIRGSDGIPLARTNNGNIMMLAPGPKAHP